MRNQIIRSLIGFALFGVSTTSAVSETVLQDSYQGTSTIFYIAPIGQTFKAIGSNASLAFAFSDVNPINNLNGEPRANEPLKMVLYQGVGDTGTRVGIASQTLTPGIEHEFVDFDFSHLDLQVGQNYTAIIEDSTVRWAVDTNQHSYPNGDPLEDGGADYVDGDLLSSGQVRTIQDMRFRWYFLPDAEQALTALASTSAEVSRLTVLATRRAIQGQVDRSFDLRAADFARNTRGPASRDENTPAYDGGDVSNLLTWVDYTNFDASDNATSRSFRGAGLQVGADMPVTSNLVAGLSFGATDISTSFDAIAHDGKLLFLQPYLGFRTGPWSAEATVMYGHSDVDQVNERETGEGNVTLTALTMEGGYDIEHALGTFRPMISFAAGRVKAEGTTGLISGTGTETAKFSELSMGARYSRPFEDGIFFAGFHSDYRHSEGEGVASSDYLETNGWTGRLEFGANFDVADRVNLVTSFELGGIGGNLRQTSGSILLTRSF